MEDLKNIVEALVFVSEEPLSLEHLKKLIPEADPKEIRQAIETLVTEYENRQGGFKLKEVAGGLQFRSRPEYHDWIGRYLKPNPVRLSKASLETLAIIAYRQPIIRADIEHIRGVDSGGVLRMLLERKLIRVLGRKDIPGRPLIYATTKQFLELFDLKDLKDLPSLKEIEEFGKQAEDLLRENELETTDSTEAASVETGIAEGDTAPQSEAPVEPFGVDKGIKFGVLQSPADGFTEPIKDDTKNDCTDSESGIDAAQPLDNKEALR